ncbi:inner membrane-spanning protein YciB [Nocardia sp. 348MFTsu5.1]|uniref:inner membrane-spanning protein YciB n=1 Tax=Nocardia sp. 348MFTsu5.1 TaxID=1172185 RepID=UPI000374BE0B|nr:septation protein IspZ [Nocardia sp. 348MFTsu5.1]
MLFKLAYNIALALGFLVTYRVAGIFAATGVLMGGVTLEVAYIFAKGRRPTRLEWIGLALVLALGAATLLIGDALFIEWRPTGFYWLCAAALAGSRLWMKTNPISALLGGRISLTSRVWDQVLWLWAAFLTLLGALNLVVAYNFSVDTWVNYRVFVAPALIAAVGVAMIVWRRNEVKQAWRRHRHTPATVNDDTSSPAVPENR